MRGFVPWERRSTAFEGCSVLVVPSRSEPFGLIVLEAMQHGVPVLFVREAGVAEVMKSGIQISNDTPNDTAEIIEKLLNDESYWQETMLNQLREVNAYYDRGYETRVIDAWSRALGSAAAA
jgi:glycosyltransferase involved in cell wall biosynthesis